MSDGLEDRQVVDRRMEKQVDKWADGSVEEQVGRWRSGEMDRKCVAEKVGE